MRIASLTLLCLALAAVPAFAQSYNNGPINGTTDAWTINFGYVVSDTFVVTPNATVDGVEWGLWEFPGDSVSSMSFTVTSGESGGTQYYTFVGSPNSDSFISTNQYGYDIDVVVVTNINITLNNGGTYWLNVFNAAVPSGDPVYWDENSGPSSASESSVGTIPSEAFTIQYTEGGTTPEPSSIMLFGSGLLGLAGLLRRKLF